jgi:hypothetical protein
MVGIAEEVAMGSYRYRVGETVECLLDVFTRYAAPGDYKILGLLPEREGQRHYRIKSPLESHERVMMESLLRRSDGNAPAAFSS